MRTRTYFYFLRQSFINLSRNALMSIASIGIVTVSLLILGSFMMFATSINHLIGGLESQVEVIVFLKDSTGDLDIQKLQAEFQKLPDISEMKFVSKAEAFGRLKEKMGNQSKVLNSVKSNPLPNSFEIKAKDPEKVEALAALFMRQPQVEEVKYGKEVVDKLFAFTKIVRIIGVCIMLILSVATIYIIVNTIRLTVFARRKEIRIMKLVGATDWFIRWPFIIEGVLLGFLGALIAVFLIQQSYVLLISELQKQLPFLPLTGDLSEVTQLSYCLLVVGTVIGSLGSTISLRKFLQG